MFTRALVVEAKRTREESIKPNIVITIEPFEKAVNQAIICIENIGNGAAYDINIIEKNDITITGLPKKLRMNGASFMKLKILKPNQKISSWIGEFRNLPRKDFIFSISGKDLLGKNFECSNNVDVTYLENTGTFHIKGLSDIAEYLNEIKQSVAKISNKS